MPKRALWILFAASTVLPSLAMANHGENPTSTKVNLLYHKLFTRPVGARPADGSAGKAQPGEEWDGTAPLPDPAGVTGGGDLREFQVAPDFTTAKVTAAITWDAGTAVTYDLDLFIDRQDAATGAWVQVGSGTDGQLAGDGEPAEVAEVSFPIPGKYRTRVANFASPGRGRGITGARDLLRPIGRHRPDSRHERHDRELDSLDEGLARDADRREAHPARHLPRPRQRASRRHLRARVEDGRRIRAVRGRRLYDDHGRARDARLERRPRAEALLRVLRGAGGGPEHLRDRLRVGRNWTELGTDLFSWPEK
jgi:hypothetical protein